jgi:outer membrane lipoprotein-sorting protein
LLVAKQACSDGVERQFLTICGDQKSEGDAAPHQNCDKRAKGSQDCALKRNRKFQITASSITPRAARVCAFVVGVATIVHALPVIAHQGVRMPRVARNANGNMQLSTDSKLTTGSTQTQTPPNPIIPDPRRNVPSNIFATFDDKQKAEAAKVSAYLSSLQTLVGNFVQVGPDGSKTKGDFYIQKPGKVRFEYDPPTPIEIIADGSSLAVRDRNLATQDIYPLSQTPLRFLLSDRIDLMKDTNVVSVTADDLFISVTIEEKQALVGTSRLMLMLGAKDGQLKQWTVTDPQGYDTTVAVYNLDTTKKVDPSLFKIDFTRYPTSPG